MSGTYYEYELENLKETYQVAIEYDVSDLKDAIAGASESSLIGIGSGGSFTAASLMCNLHETFTGRVSRPSTPLEIICNPTLASSSPVFLISAEGKNPDITEALERARHHSARTIHVLTNREDTPLMACAERLTDVNTHVFELTEKDGYLATNSLLLDALLIAKAYGELDGNAQVLPDSIDDLHIGDQSITQWVDSATSFIESSVKRGAVVVTYSPLLQPVAIDLESKLSEAALLHCQLADLRSFAHGRHLWLAERPDDITILALIDPLLSDLWERMCSLFPQDVPTFTMKFSGTHPRDLTAGLVAQMRLVQSIAECIGKDPGRPNVPQFGRDLYYIDLPKFVAEPIKETPAEEQSKYDVLGARWPFSKKGSYMSRALKAFLKSISDQSFRAIVFDYDGTLCSSNRKTSPLSQPVLGHIQRLVESNVIVGIVSGRGGSIVEQLHGALDNSILKRIYTGLYNGGWIGFATEQPVANTATSEFLSHVTRIANKLKSNGVPIKMIRTTHPFQVSILFRDGLLVDQMWFVIADALRQAGLETNTLYRSKHSVDVLAPNISKSGLIAHIIQKEKIDPHQVITMGDQGAWPGNDVALLEHRYSLSVDMPSRRLDRGWKLAPGHKRDVDATLWYLDRIQINSEGNFSFSFHDADLEESE